MAGAPKLTEADREEILDRHAAGENCSVIARDFGVASSTVLRVVNGETWRRKPDDNGPFNREQIAAIRSAPRTENATVEAGTARMTWREVARELRERNISEPISPERAQRIGEDAIIKLFLKLAEDYRMRLWYEAITGERP